MLGTTLNHYRIVRALGSGGMGEVYAAEDLTLHRLVALKVLPAPLAADPERRLRFEREAQAVAALNHPNIVTIHSVEHSGELHFLTMELVEGKALSELIPGGGLPVDRVLKLAVPLADAISAAHQRGITHRDLKPANIMVTDDGRVKVLDFGLAKLKENQPAAESVTAMPTGDITGEGRILGTVAYMSPEQAEGRPIDQRSDIFSLGVTLYEMAVGTRPFSGDTTVSVLSSILRDTPRRITEINPTLPRDLARIVRRCLMKDPEQRYQSAKDVRNDLEELKQALDSGEIASMDGAPRQAAVRIGRRLVVVGILIAAVVGVATVFLFRSMLASRSTPIPIEATFTQLTTQPGIERFPSLAPDGKWVVYTASLSGNEDIYLQSVGGQTTINLTKDSPAADRHPVFSPDGERIAFRSERDGGGIFVMGRTGESVKRITDTGFDPAWSPTGEEIVYATEPIVHTPTSRGPRSALRIVNVATAATRELTAGDAVQPHWSPHGHRIAYWSARGPGRQRDIVTMPSGGGEAVLVTDDAVVDWTPVWSPDGRHLYFSSERGGSMNLWRVPIDEQSGRVRGTFEPITSPSKFVAHLSLSADGRRLAYTSMEFSQNLERVGFDPVSLKPTGAPAPVTTGSKLWQAWSDVSPDDQWIVLSSDRPQEDLFVVRIDGSGLRQVTSDAAFDRRPHWSPDGKRIAFQSNRNGSWEAWAINPDGSGLVQLTKDSGAHGPLWSPDGSRMAFSEFVNVNRVSTFDPRKAWESQTAERLPAVPGAPAWVATSWSPDGRWLAGYRAPQGGIVIYSLDSRTYTTLSEVGWIAVWLNDGRQLLFSTEQGVSTADRQSGKTRALPSMQMAGLAVTSISRDNRYVYLSRGSADGDVWMATLK